MKKVILDFTAAESNEEVQDLIQNEMDLPEYYGRNLDALYDCLTEIHEDTAIGFYQTMDGSPVSAYLNRVRQVFEDAEEENSHLAVFFLTTYAVE